MNCDQCNKEIIVTQVGGGTGYATDKLGNKICYECCGENDSKELAEAKLGERFYMYWDNKKITNWPGTLVISPIFIKESKHNIARTRTDVWFYHKGIPFHGYNVGNNTQVLHVKRIKKL